MSNCEILAPVGAKEQLYAAVRCGANAVYLGTSNFNARRNADNFTTENLKEAVDYCHLRNVKVYVTLNTLVFNKELDDLYKTVEAIAKSNADAVIVQDFATVKAVKDICPTLPIHASTQMAVHNVSGAKVLEDMGFSRIVLARELSEKEFRLIRESVNAELEVFVHGAHCMGASGNCYLSAMLGERSGNRGLCAQGCRLNWVSQHGREYALSLKDMSYLDSIKSLSDIGINSFKIEGRMKRPEYVAAAVTSLKNALDNQPYDKNTLRSVFSRSGFTDGYLKGKRTSDMFGYRVKDDVTSANNVLKDLESLYKNDIHPTPLNAELVLCENAPSKLTLSSGAVTVYVTGDIAEVPRNAPLPYEIALRNVSKLGDTPFYLNNFEFSNDHNLTLSASSVNDLRRRGIDLLCKELTKSRYNVQSEHAPKSGIYRPEKPLTYRVRLNSFSQFTEALSSAEYIILPIDEVIKNAEKLDHISHKIIVELPALIYPEAENIITDKLEALKGKGFSKGITGNIGGIALLKKCKFSVFGGNNLNVTNVISLEEYSTMGLEDVTLSFELTQKAISSLGGATKRGALIYGHLPIMYMRACPQKGVDGCGKCNGATTLTDRKGIQFPLLCHNKEYSVLHNSVPLYIGDKSLNSIDFGTLYFTTEGATECAKIFDICKKSLTLPGKKTNGLFARELL